MRDEREPAAVADTASATAQVLDIVRELAAEAVGERAAAAAHPDASLERDLGLGSLERVELLMRLEDAFGRRLPQECLQLDTPAALARAVTSAEAVAEEAHQRRAPELGAAAPITGSQTMQEALWRRAQAEPRRPHVYLREEGAPGRTVGYADMWEEAAAVAAGLRARGIRPGDRVALMLPTGMDFLRSFQGILAAQAVAVPIYPPARLDRLEEYARRQAAILRDAGARLLITVERARPVAAMLKPGAPALEQVTTAAALAEAGTEWRGPAGSPDDPALIQYTSGSTGAPKGVLLSQANLLANVDAVAAGLQAGPGDVGVSWLPLYHDMGLIGTWLFCLCHGVPLDLQSPLDFLARPERWLWAIHERRGTMTAAPNFAYELCASRVPERALEGLDLSSWRCALNGAEPVSPETLERFTRRFAKYGFRPEAMMPVYGLAECAVGLCFPPPGRGARVRSVERARFERAQVAVPAAEGADALRFVSVGTPLPRHEVRIVDEQGGELPEGHVGRLVFRGPSMTSGYYGKPEATAAITVEGGWLDSGDLAFVLDGEVHITGRSKDLIIKAGRNLVPQEIEELAAGVSGVRRGCVAAFGAPDPQSGTERLVVVAETRATEPVDRDRMAAEVTARVADALGVPPDVVAMVAPGAVLKTSSGKIRRAETRDLYLSGRLGRGARTSIARRARLLLGAGRAEVARAAGSAGHAAYAVYLALVLAALFATLWPLAMLLPGARAPQRVARFASRLLLFLAGIKVKVEGHASFPAGPCVLASNHASFADAPVLLAVLPAETLYVVKRELLGWPLVGPFLRKTGHLPVDRFDSRQGLADAARVSEALGAGASVLFFPEGTFTPTTGLRPFRLGAFQAAAQTGVPVVPVALRGTRRLLRDGVWRPRPGTAHVWIGAPLAPAGPAWRDAVALRDETAAQIAAHCGEPRLDIIAGLPVPRE